MGERPRLGTSRRSFGPVFDQRAGFPSTTCTPLDSPSLPLSFPVCLQHSFSLPPDWHTKKHLCVYPELIESKRMASSPIVLADAAPSAFFALASSPSVRADARPSALLAQAPSPSVLADARPSTRRAHLSILVVCERDTCEMERVGAAMRALERRLAPH